MTRTNPPNWLRFLLRPTRPRLALGAALLAALVGYLIYFTPHKRAVRLRLNEADAKSQKAIDERMKPLDELFAKGRKGSKAFAAEALSWNGKWQYVKGLVNGRDSHRHYLAAAFTRHVFTPEELREAMEAAVRAYLDDLEGIESEMLVQLRIDLANPEHRAQQLSPHVHSDEEFRGEYRKLAGSVTDQLRIDVGVTVAREAGMFVATDVATQVALQAARAAAAEMGVGATLLSAGAVSTIATLGLGLVVAIIIDYVLNEILRIAGYDPEAKIESLVCSSINRMQDALLRVPETGLWGSSGKKGSLRQRLEELHKSRSKLRRETVIRLRKEGGI